MCDYVYLILLFGDHVSCFFAQRSDGFFRNHMNYYHQSDDCTDFPPSFTSQRPLHISKSGSPGEGKSPSREKLVDSTFTPSSYSSSGSNANINNANNTSISHCYTSISTVDEHTRPLLIPVLVPCSSWSFPNKRYGQERSMVLMYASSKRNLKGQ